MFVSSWDRRLGTHSALLSIMQIFGAQLYSICDRHRIHHAEVQARENSSPFQDPEKGQRADNPPLRQHPGMHPQIPLYLRFQCAQHAEYIPERGSKPAVR